MLNRKLLLVVLYGAALLFQGCATGSMQMTPISAEEAFFTSQTNNP